MSNRNAHAMLSIAVVDDDPVCLAEAAAAVRAYVETRGEDAEIATFADATAFLAGAADRRFDIAILDVIMPEKSGVQAALELFERDSGCLFIFFTASPDYAIEGYKVNAVDYLLKPVDAETIGTALDKARHRANAKPPARTIILRDGREAKKVDTAEILYCQSDGRNVTFHGADWILTCRGKLGDFAARLPAHFVQTHNRYLANLEQVKAMASGEMRLGSGDVVPISRAYREGAAKRYFDHVAGEARRK